MEYKKKLKKRTINEYRQVKDSVYKSPHKARDSFRHLSFITDIQNLCKQFHQDSDLGGAIRRAVKKYNENEQRRDRA